MSKVPKHIPLPGRDPCQYCGDEAMLHETSIHIYGKDYGPVWQCQLCAAYVGCHPGTFKALGRLANKELRGWKMKTHEHLDALYKRRASKDIQKMNSPSKRTMAKTYGRSRGKAYAWLAEQMGLDGKECHIGYFTVEQCKRAVEICQPYTQNMRIE